MPYAETTKVAPEKTRQEIEKLLAKHGAQSFAYASAPGRATVMFEAFERRIKFVVPLPKPSDRGAEQALRSRWRGLLLCIKAKLESVESRIESFDEAFLAHVVMPDGQTVHEHVRGPIQIAYEGGEMPPLLEEPR